MADPIAIAEKIIEVAVYVHGVIEEIRAFPELAAKLDYKIQLMKPTLDYLTSMRNQRRQLQYACKRHHEHMDLFSASLTEMLKCIEEVRVFINEIKVMSNLRKIRERGNVNARYEKLTWKLDEIQKGLQFGVLAEVRKEVARNPRADKVDVLISHARNSGAFSSKSRHSTGGRATQAADQKLFSGSLPVLRLDDVDILEHLGRGGFGEVWKAKDNTGQELAVKIFDIADNKTAVKEASKMQRVINSPSIVRLAGIIDEPECRAIVMDYFENGSLKSFMKYLDCDCWARRSRMLCDISIGINYLHSLKPPIIHKDLKACNIFIDHGMKAKLGDLGLAVSSTTTKPKSQSVLTGTVSHIPPEAWAGTLKEANEAWDIYEFGITLYEFISGRNPWPSYATEAIIRGWVYTDNKRPDEKDIKVETPIEIKQLMKTCWQTNPKRRPTAKAIQTQLLHLFETKFGREDLRRADRAIFNMMDILQKSAKGTAHQSSDSHDSGRGSDLAASFGDMSFTGGATAIYLPKRNTDCGIVSGDRKVEDRREWYLEKEFGKKGDGEGEFRLAYGVAVLANGEIAAVDRNHVKNLFRVYVLNKSGVYQHTIKSTSSDPKEKLLYPFDLTVTPNHQSLVIVDTSPKVKFFTPHGTFLCSFSTLSTQEDPTTWVNTPMQVAVNQQGVAVVGNLHRRVLTIHTERDGWAPRKVPLSIEPVYVSVDTHRIFVTGLKEEGKACIVMVLDMDGKVVHTIHEFKVDGKIGEPQGIACDANGDVYIAVMKFNHKTGKVIFNSGHIHCYDSNYKFIKCIAKNLYRPMGMTMSHTGSLFVANAKSVLVYSRK